MNAAACLIAWVLTEPPPGDAYRLPPIQALTAGRQFNLRYQRHLEWRLEWEYHTSAGPRLRAALAESRRLYEVWDCAEGAHPDWKCEPKRKADYLRRLRLLIGRDAYYRAELPPPVPYHLFNQLR